MSKKSNIALLALLEDVGIHVVIVRPDGSRSVWGPSQYHTSGSGKVLIDINKGEVDYEYGL